MIRFLYYIRYTFDNKMSREREVHTGYQIQHTRFYHILDEWVHFL